MVCGLDVSRHALNLDVTFERVATVYCTEIGLVACTWASHCNDRLQRLRRTSQAVQDALPQPASIEIYLHG